MLNLARGVQGVGGAAMFATSLALLASAFHGTRARDGGRASGAPPSARPSPSARWSAALLTETIGWESIFYVNVPIGIAAIYISLTRVAESKDPNAGPNDWLGLVTFSGGLFLLIFALVRGNAEGWGSTLIVSFLIGAVVLLVAFVVVEARIEHPMFDLTLFRKPTFGGACIAAFALSASMFSMFLYLTLYIQNGAGLLAAGGRACASCRSRCCRSSSRRWRAGCRRGCRSAPSSAAACCSSTIALLLMRGLSASSEWTALLGGFIVAGVGVALVNAPLASTAVSVVPPERAGMGSGINSTFRQVGIATGTAALGALFQHILASDASGRAGARARRGPRAGPRAACPGRRPTQAYLTLFTDGLNDILLVAAIVAFAGAVLSFVLIRGSDFVASAGRWGARRPSPS